MAAGDFQASGGAIIAASLLGNGVALSRGRASAAMSDANYTVLAAQYQALAMEFTGALTAQRNVVVPLTDGAVWIVDNRTTGGFGIQVIGPTGTGIVIGAAKTAIVRCDGTNIVRVTADA